MNSAVYPEEVEHLSKKFGTPRTLTVEIVSCPEFQRAFRASLRRRRAEVGFAIRRASGKILVSTKAFYPPGLFRLPTGGVKPGEAVEEALWREITEETGLLPTSASFVALIEYCMMDRSIPLRFATYLFIVDALDGEPYCTDPDEEISEYRELSATEIKKAGDTLANLGPDWKSWGQWRSVPHYVIADILNPGC